MTVVVNQQLQALRHAAADARDEIEISGCPLLSNPVLQFFHRLRVMCVDAAFEGNTARRAGVRVCEKRGWRMAAEWSVEASATPPEVAPMGAS